MKGWRGKLRAAAGGIACALVLFLAVDLDLRARAKTQFLGAQSLEAQGNWWEAATLYLRALRHHAPGNPWSVRADARLFAIAADREKAGDPGKAAGIYGELVIAYRVLKSSYRPFTASRARAEEALRRLAVKEPPGFPLPRE